MSSADQRQSSATNGREVIKKSFNLSGRVDSPVEQLPFSEEAPSAVGLLRSAK